MSIYLVVLLSVLNSIGQRGGTVAIALFALVLGAGAGAVGVLAALFAPFPLLLGLQAGRISDRFGVRLPIVCGSLTMAAGLCLAFFTTSIPLLFLCPALIGLGHIFFHVSIHNLVAHSAPTRRARATSRLSRSAARSPRSSGRRSPASPSSLPAFALRSRSWRASRRRRDSMPWCTAASSRG